MAAIRLVTLVAVSAALGCAQQPPAVRQFLSNVDHGNPAAGQVPIRYVQFPGRPGGPAILYNVYMGKAVEKFHAPLFLSELAAHLGATLFIVEHRCHQDYQRPGFPVQYCTSDQALRDYASFITYQNTLLPPGTKWIAMGCSYPARLSIQLRGTYPELVHAAYGTGGPTVATVYNPVQVRKAAEMYARGCRRLVKGFVATPAQVQASPCIRLIWQYYSLYTNDEEMHKKLAAQMCQVYLTGQCDDLQVRSATRPPPVMWFYQLCNEFGWFWTSEQHKWNDFCRQHWGPSWDVGTLQTQVQAANGGMRQLMQRTSRTLEVNWAHDSWSANTFNESFPGVDRATYPGGSHCVEYKSSTDPVVLMAKQQITSKIVQYLQE